MKKRIWFEPCPGVRAGIKGVILYKKWGFKRVLIRDLNGKCFKFWHPNPHYCEREASKLPPEYPGPTGDFVNTLMRLKLADVKLHVAVTERMYELAKNQSQ